MARKFKLGRVVRSDAGLLTPSVSPALTGGLQVDDRRRSNAENENSHFFFYLAFNLESLTLCFRRYLGDGRFHLESIMIANPEIPAYRYDSRADTHVLNEYG